MPIISSSSTSSGGGALLYSFTLTGAQAAIDTNVDGPAALLAGTYNLLEVHVIGRTADAAAVVNMNAIFNNDGGANYDANQNVVANATVTASTLLAQTAINFPLLHGNGGGASYPGHVVMWIPAYAATTFFKAGTYLSSSLDSTAANSRGELGGFAWRSTAAITRIKVTSASGGNLAVGSSLLVYGR